MKGYSMGMGMREMGGFRASQQVSAAYSQWQQRRQGFDALAQALQAGDLSKAQAAYANLTSKLPSGAATDPNSPLAKIGAALQAGDLATAQASLPHRNGRMTKTKALPAFRLRMALQLLHRHRRQPLPHREVGVIMVDITTMAAVKVQADKPFNWRMPFQVVTQAQLSP